MLDPVSRKRPKFQSTTSIRRLTAKASAGNVYKYISIHNLHPEVDQADEQKTQNRRTFQSTTSIRRLTANFHNFLMSICPNITKFLYYTNPRFHFFIVVNVLFRDISRIIWCESPGLFMCTGYPHRSILFISSNFLFSWNYFRGKIF